MLGCDWLMKILRPNYKSQKLEISHKNGPWLETKGKTLRSENFHSHALFFTPFLPKTIFLIRTIKKEEVFNRKKKDLKNLWFGLTRSSIKTLFLYVFYLAFHLRFTVVADTLDALRKSVSRFISIFPVVLIIVCFCSSSFVLQFR